MVSSIAHGVKGILTGLNAGIYLIDSGYTKNQKEQIEEGLEVSKLMAERIRRVSSNVLFYSKKRVLHWEQVDVLTFMTDVAVTIEDRFQEETVDFVKEFDPYAGTFEIDTELVRSALINILENALDACLEDASKPSHQVVFKVTKEEGTIRIDISDNGIGMNTEDRRNIFGLFFSSKGTKGTGLGLYITDKVIRQHGGEIIVESEPEKGTRFLLILPKELPESAKQKPLEQVLDFEFAKDDMEDTPDEHQG
jgi:signal transduction histidine kinase